MYRGDGEVALADVLTDPRPRHAAQVQQRDSPMPQVVRAERRRAGRGASAGDRRTEPVTAEALEHAALGSAILARHKRADSIEQHRRYVHPPGALRLRDDGGDAPAAPLLVDVAPGELLELAEPHRCRVQDEQRQPVTRRQRSMHGLDVLRSRRLGFLTLLARQPHTELVAGWVRQHTGIVKRHRRRLHDLPDVARLAALPP